MCSGGEAARQSGKEHLLMYSKVLSGLVQGIDGTLISVETDIHDGLPVMNMVGYLSSCVKEAGERVRTALRNSGFNIPPKRITINLFPADIRKEGTAFDLPIAAGMLASMGVIPTDNIKNILILGELGLDGHVNTVSGVLSIVHSAYSEGVRSCIVPAGNSREAAIIRGMTVIPVTSIGELVDHLSGIQTIEPEYVDVEAMLDTSGDEAEVDFSEVMGHESLKRGVEIAAAGMHNILMTGPAGAGKSMIARRIPTILPRLSLEESIEITKVYSVAGLLDESCHIINRRPFRAPHHTISLHALSGGGHNPRPGEISLAHGGSLITADQALEQGREVYAVPGRITDSGSRGCNGLIRMGAVCVTQVEDILDEMGINRAESKAFNKNLLAPAEKKVYSCVRLESRHIDDICFETGISVSEVTQILYELEQKRLIKQLVRNYYVRA